MRLGKNALLFLLLVAGTQAAEAKTAYPPLPEAVSSFGAAVCDGFVYVYGGHSGKAHQYSTETVSGKFRRLSLADPSRGWEELPGGPALQGLALVSHDGKLYRVGGMQPRNAPGDKADNEVTVKLDDVVLVGQVTKAYSKIGGETKLSSTQLTRVGTKMPKQGEEIRFGWSVDSTVLVADKRPGAAA